MWTALASHPWAYPALEAVHVLGIALLFGGLLVFELRLLGLGRALQLAALARLVLPLALLGFALCALTGLCMFATQPQELLANPAFRLKLLLLMLAGANAAWFHARGSLAVADVPARVQGLVSVGIWVAVIICGRFIAYV
ncbi:MAG: hypothetical protein ACT6S0_12555 [Roseateles sp.]|uniref:hypothetical protein n=1 Tax=Roseateles sp. TaxID=1971397 RepID=UPI004036632A